jgi:hypothetical protein
MLSRASCPGIWEQQGYPPLPILPALVGAAVHRALELILRGLHAEGCESLSAQCSVDVLKDLGGYSNLATRVVEEDLSTLRGNPRLTERIPKLRSDLRARIPEIRRRLQALVARTTLIPVSPVPRVNGVQAARMPMREGSYPEIELRSPELRFVGRADLLTIEHGTCSITDFKTGAADPHHADQLRTYALLWSRDYELNPNRVPIRDLVIAYATHDEHIEPPTDSDLDLRAQELMQRTTDAESELVQRPPVAKPAAAMCRYCTVRHLCDEYWTSPAADDAALQATAETAFFDVEATVVSQNGPRSWIVKMASDQAVCLLQTPTEKTGFIPGDRLRLLDLATSRSGEEGSLTLSVTRASEVYVLGDRTG